MSAPETEAFSAGDPVVMTNELSSRYGRVPRRRVREGWLIGGIAALFVVIFGVWAVWAGFGGTSHTLGDDVIGSTIDNEAATATVRFSVSVKPGTPYHCAVEAVDEHHTIVGWKVFSYPATSRQQTAHEETIRIIQPAVTGLIYDCWLT